MSRIHDLGGAHGMGPISVEPDEAAPFENLWEARVFALMKVCMDRGLFTLDEMRHAIERLPPDVYLRAPYYERWYLGLATLLTEKGVVAPDDLVEKEA
jgi:nitrile hydratase subunit beta